MKTERLVSIDIARAICVILVVVGHYIPDNSPVWYVKLRDVIYTFHMPLFMFLSGYIYWITQKTVKYGDFVLKKFYRLMVPYFFTSMVIIVVKLISERSLYIQNPISLSAFYEMFYLPVAGYFLWFVYALFLIFLIIPLFNTYNKLILLLVISLVLYFIPLELTPLFCLAQLKKQIIYFVLGCLLVEWSNIRRVLKRGHFLFVLVAFVFIFSFKTANILEIDLINELLLFIIALLGIFFILSFSTFVSVKTNYFRQFFCFISTSSFTIYLFHTTFQGFTKAVLVKIPLSAYLGYTPMFIISALIVVVVGLVAPIVLNKYIVTYSKALSFLIGEKFIGKKLI